MYCKSNQSLPGSSGRCCRHVIRVDGLGADGLGADEIREKYGEQSWLGKKIQPEFQNLLKPVDVGPQLMPTDKSRTEVLRATMNKWNPMTTAGIGPTLMPGFDPITSMLIMKSPLGKTLKPLMEKIPFGNAASGLLNTVLSPITNIVAGFTKKATHMESCMKWWTDSNMRGMVSGMEPIPISFRSIVELYKAEMPTYIRARFDETRVTESIVAHLLTRGRRKLRIGDFYIQSINENPDVKEMQCASMPQGRAETGVSFDEVYMETNFWGPMREQAREVEFMDTLEQAVGIVKQRFDSILDKVLAQQEKDFGVVQSQRQSASMFTLPTGVIGIRKGVVQVATKGGSIERKL